MYEQWQVLFNLNTVMQTVAVLARICYRKASVYIDYVKLDRFALCLPKNKATNSWGISAFPATITTDHELRVVRRCYADLYPVMLVSEKLSVHRR